MADEISHYRRNIHTVELLARWLERLPSRGRRRWLLEIAARLFAAPLAPAPHFLSPARFRLFFGRLGTASRGMGYPASVVLSALGGRLVSARSPWLKR